jgi:TonB-linked SusC/RagA family outer membrane protein
MLILSCLFLSSGFIVAQTTKVNGTVTDSHGEPVISASVVVKGTTVGTVTDVDGKFSLDVSGEKNTLAFKLVGMKTVEMKASKDMKVVMIADETLLDEVVVVAYGTQSARTVASSISTVRADAIKDVPNVSFDQMLQGRASGVQITTPSAGVGQPPIVRVRGVNSITSGTQPLYVVDGIPIVSGDIASMGNSNALADINPSDIVSMEVLKDASAGALYGSRAANGVILITTRKGSKGKLKVSYDGYFGFGQKTGFYEMLNAREYVDFKNMAVKNRYGTDLVSGLPSATFRKSEYGDKAFNLMTKPGGGYYDSDWSKSAFRNGMTHSHTLSFSGGNDLVQYYISANYMDKEGIVKGDKYDRYGFKANVTANATNWLKLGADVNATSSATSYVDAARNGANFSVGGFPRMALINSPNIPIFDESGAPWGGKGGLGYGPNAVNNTYSNPEKILEIGNGIDTESNRVISNFFGEIKPVKGFTAKTQFGLDYNKVEDTRFWSPLQGDGVNSGGLANGYSATHKRWTWTNTLNYNFSINKDHHFDILAGAELSAYKLNYWNTQRTGLQDDKFTGIEGPFLNATSSGNITENSLASFFGRINYDFAYKYILSLNYRRDGFSALGANNKWGNFGGVSVAYRISEESFFDPLKGIVEDLKIKGSFGVVGNTDIANYASKSYYGSYFYGTNGVYQLNQVGDPDLKWESSNKYDIGFNATFLDKFTLDFDYYLTKSKDLILKVPQAPSKGIPGNLITTNVGEMKNSGVELTLGVDIVNREDFRWSTGFNITTNRNEVVSLAPGVEQILGSDASNLETSSITVPGKSIGQVYVYPTAGIDKKTGRRIFIGTKGERVLVSVGQNPVTGASASSTFWNEDGTPFEGNIKQEMYGGSLPTWYGGWSNNFSYKRFDLSLFFQFSGGNKIYNGTHATVSDMRFWNNTKEILANYWTPERTDAKYPIPVYGDNVSNGSAYQISDWVEKGDYLRLKNVSLGYTFNTNASWARRLGISGLRLFAQAQNLFVITGYSGIDPEALTNVASPTLAGGTDKNTLPQERAYTFGLNLTF